MTPALVPWAVGCMVVGMSERPRVRRPALLANGAFLLPVPAAAVLAAL